jgi:hypothetical protein
VETEIRAGAVLDILTADELKTVLEEVASGYLRLPYRKRIIGTIKLDGSGNGVSGISAKARPGFTLIITRLCFTISGGANKYTFAAPFSPGSAGAIEFLRGTGGSTVTDLVDGYAFGASTGGSLPCVYTNSESHAVEVIDQEDIRIQVLGGPASSNLDVIGSGMMIPTLLDTD